MKSSRSRIAAGLAFGAVLVVAGAFGVVRSDRDVAASAIAGARASRTEAAAVASVRSAATLDDLVVQLEARVASHPGDHVAWSTLGLAYVQQAHVTANGDLYPRAKEALDTSLEVNDDQNFLAYAGLSAWSSARHDFGQAREYAVQGLEINDYSAILHGALSDAELQLGHYPEAFAAVQRMVDLSPDTASLTRASYTWEIRGEVARATQLMQRALDDAPTPSDRSFALLHLGDLAFNAGDSATALTHYDAALAATPDSAAAQAGAARALAALGQAETALDHYRALVARGLEPFYILQYAQLLESLGRTEEAATQFALYEEQESEFAAREVVPDATFILYFADHGQPGVALEKAEKAIGAAGFLDTYDAYAWSLHANGRHEDAWTAMEQALSLGSDNALFHYHAGMIRLALGDVTGARTHLTTALALNPNFQLVAASTAQQTLDDLGGPLGG